MAIVGLAVATPALAAIVALLATLPLRKPGLNNEDALKLAAIVAVLGALTAAGGWMLVRLLRGTSSTNGVTMMPVWFVRVCGLAFLAGTGWMAWLGGIPRVVLTTFGMVGLSMVFISGKPPRVG
jgi:hypothetical protein